ncbi:MAG: glycogen/starch synthase [Bacteroidetes bacterium]|jgi:starch synthase|nr:glycogen/starch synthase [Bacteroidota bacterium]MDF1867091.1 glycogen/starch synthase [Saprospiraceae bacterium]
MTDKKKVLIVTQEMQPYTALSEISEIARKLPQYVQEKGMEIRVLMPRFGTINERRHRLHEVVRLSGMNIIVDDDDFPLIIKVASLPGARMQVYFLDNEDFFRRKSVFENAEGKPFEDNADRMVFFCKGVIETVKKFGWPPDIIHCHGWMTSLIPIYIREAYKTEPLFHHSKIIYSLYDNSLGETFTDGFYAKASINNLEEDDLGAYKNEKGVNLHKGAISYSDAIIQGSESLSDSVSGLIENLDKPILEHQSEEDYLKAYLEFYNTLLAEQEVEG